MTIKMNVHKKTQYILKEIGYNPNHEVLDLGAGDGILKKFYTKYTAIDYNEERKHYSKKDFDYINHDLNKGLPKLDKKYDKIFMLDLIEHVENFMTLLKDCKKCLKPNGEIVIATPSNIRFILMVEDRGHIHCFRKTNIINIARILGLNYYFKGIYIGIPILNWGWFSKNTIYNNSWLIRLSYYDYKHNNQKVKL